MIAGINISQQIFAIDMFTTLKPSLKHDRKHVLRTVTTIWRRGSRARDQRISASVVHIISVRKRQFENLASELAKQPVSINNMIDFMKNKMKHGIKYESVPRDKYNARGGSLPRNAWYGGAARMGRYF